MLIARMLIVVKKNRLAKCAKIYIYHQISFLLSFCLLESSPGWSRWAKPPCQCSPLAWQPLQAGKKVIQRVKSEKRNVADGFVI